jgi:hypothetical protein
MLDKILDWSNKLSKSESLEINYCFLTFEPYKYEILSKIDCPYTITNQYIIISKTYNINYLNKFINMYQNSVKSKIYMFMYPFEFIPGITETLDIDQKITVKKLLISRTNLNKKCIDGYFSYYSKKFKEKKNLRTKILYEKSSSVLKGEPFEQCYKDKYIVQGTFRSSYILGPELTALKNEICNKYKEIVINNHQEVTLPKYTTETHFSRTNHIRLPEHTYFIAKLNKEVVPLKELYGYLYKKWNIDNSKDIVVNGLSSYGVCEVFWSYLENQNINKPFRYFDNSGFTLRNEGNAIKSLERLDSFSRIESIFGYFNEETLEKHIDNHVERMKTFLEYYDLHYRILEVESWTPVEIGKDLCKVKTIDFEIYLEYKNDWLEIGNISNNGYNFSKPFNVTHKNNYIVTGCAGLGIERCLFAVIHQKGYKHIKKDHNYET